MDIVWFAEIKWDYLKTRKQQIIRRKPSDVRLLYLEPFVKGRVNRFELRRDGDILCATVPFIKAVPGSPLRWILDRRWGRAAVDRLVRSKVRRIMRQAGMVPSETGLVLSNVYAIDVARRVQGKFLLYDCNDVHDAFPGMPPWTARYYADACRGADAVFASSQALYDDATSLRGDAAGCHLLGNGVQFDHFKGVVDEMGWPDPPDPPRIGYLGAIAPWFNFEFVDAMARAHPEWEVVLVGPVMLGAGPEVDRLTRLANVSVRDPVPYEEVPRVLRSFTVGTIPFRYDSLTRGVNPNKMYEYLAVGLPVAASRFSVEVQAYPEVTTASETADEFVRACEHFVDLARDPSRLSVHRAQAIEIAAGHDWAVIAERFWKYVKSFATNS